MQSERLGGPPFRVGGVVGGEYFVDRARELEEVRRALRSPSRLVLHGPRRQGKSAVLQEAMRRFRRQGGVVLWVDLATVVTLEDVTRRLVASLPMDRFSPERWASRLPPGVRGYGGLPGSEQIDAFAAVGPRAPDALRGELLGVVATVDSVAGLRGWSVGVVLDDVEALLDLGDGPGDGADLLGDLLSAGSRITFLLAGSDSARLRGLVERRGVLHGEADLLPVGPIDERILAGWIELRLAGAGVIPVEGIGRRVVAHAAPRTKDVVELAQEVYLQGASAGRAGPDAVDRGLEAVIDRGQDRFRFLWRELPASQQTVLRAVARGVAALYAEETRRRHGLPATSSIRTAVRGLLAKGILSEADATGVAFDDPFFRHWTLRRALREGAARRLPAAEGGRSP